MSLSRKDVLLLILIAVSVLFFVDKGVADPPKPTGTIYTITGAADYPLFRDMISDLKWVMGFFFSVLIAGGTAAWKSIIKRIGTQRAEDKDHCIDCRSGHDKEHDSIGKEHKYIWNALDGCCPREAAMARRSDD